MTGEIYDEFAVARWPGDKWIKHHLWEPDATVECPGGPSGTLTIQASPFTISCPPHHVKVLMLSTTSFAPPDRGWIRFEVEMATVISETERNPFGADPGDPRLAAAAFNVIDPSTAMVFDFFVSNTRIAAVYERLPYAQTTENPYPAFTVLTATDVPTSRGQWHKYAVAYDRAHNDVEWWVDDRKVVERRYVGAPSHRSGPIVKPETLRMGGGLFTLVDDLNNDLQRAGDNPKTRGLDSTSAHELFGQGGQVQFRRFGVSLY